jgi:hypothetical protein
MIISHSHRCLFIEIPQTGSWSIGYVLTRHADGEPILHKHATYPEFSRQASSAERDYFVFATIRNPLDSAVSVFFKLRTDHHGAFSDPRTIDKLYTDYVDRRKFAFARNPQVGFEEYFVRHYRLPYSDLIDVSAASIDFVIRFECLQEDFSRLLELLNLSRLPPLPHTNRTEGRREDWRPYYTPRIVPRARRVFAPWMHKWDYQFPEEWGCHTISRLDSMLFPVLCMARKQYLTRLRYNNRSYARVLRALLALLR